MNSNQCTTIVVSNDRHYFISLKKLRRVLANINVIYIKRHNCCMLFVRCASTRDVAYALNLHHNNIFNYSVRIARRDTVIPVIYESDQHTFSHIVPSATNIIPEIRTNTFVERREELGTSSNINNDNHELPETSDISSLSSSLYFSFSSSTSFSFSSSTNISSHTDRETCEESNNHPVNNASVWPGPPAIHCIVCDEYANFKCKCGTHYCSIECRRRDGQDAIMHWCHLCTTSDLLPITDIDNLRLHECVAHDNSN